MSDNPYAKFAQSNNPYNKYKETPKPAPTPDEHHLFSPIEDTERAAGEASTALVKEISPTEDISEEVLRVAFPQARATRAVGDVAGVALSPLTGAIHSSLGSLAAFLQPDNPEKAHHMRNLARGVAPPGSPEPAGHTATTDEKKRSGDVISDILTSVITPGAIRKVGKVDTALQEARSAVQLENKAKVELAKRIDINTILEEQSKAAKEGVTTAPLFMNQDVTRLAKSLYARGGEVASTIKNFVQSHVSKLSDTIEDKLKSLSAMPTQVAKDQYYEARTTAAGPAYEAAFSPDKFAPMRKQIAGVHTQAEKDIHAAQLEVHAAEKNLREMLGKRPDTSAPETLGIQRAELDRAKLRLQNANHALTLAHQDKKAVVDLFQEMNSGLNVDLPGAVWSPKLQQALNFPEVRGALAKAIKNEKLVAYGENRPFVDADYAIKGWDANGDPIIGRVPTARLWEKINQTIKGIVQEHTDVDGRMDDTGRSFMLFQKRFEKELDHQIPDLEAARQIWSDKSSVINAGKLGEKFLTLGKDNLVSVMDRVKSMPQAEKDSFRLSAVNALLGRVNALNGEVKEVSPGNFQIITQTGKAVADSKDDINKIRMLFPKKEDADNFIRLAIRHQDEFKAARQISGGLPGDAEEETIKKAAKNVLYFLYQTVKASHTGNPFIVAKEAWNVWTDLGLSNNPQLNAKIAELLKSDAIQSLQPTAVPASQLPQRAARGALYGVEGSTVDDFLQKAQ